MLEEGNSIHLKNSRNNPNKFVIVLIKPPKTPGAQAKHCAPGSAFYPPIILRNIPTAVTIRLRTSYRPTRAIGCEIRNDKNVSIVDTNQVTRLVAHVVNVLISAEADPLLYMIAGLTIASHIKDGISFPSFQ